MDITKALKDLHWLPVAFRIQYKMALMVYKVLNGKGPLYLQKLISSYKQSFNSRSNKKKLLNNPTKTPQLKFYGERSFYYCAPIIWKDIDIEIKKSKTIESFKAALKTSLFKEAFKC